VPAVFRPAPEPDGECLETEDSLLIEAIETVQAALNPPPRGRWLRWSVLAAGLALIGAGALLLPQTLVLRTAAIVPDATRSQVGREALDLLLHAGAGVRLCAEPAGRQALTALRNRVLGPDWRVQVIDGLAGFEAGYLPGRIAVLNRTLVERLDSAEALAGWLIVLQLAHDARDPMLDVLGYAGTRATLGMLTSGTLPEGALQGFAAARLVRPVVWPEAGLVAARLTALSLPFAPFAGSLPSEAARLAAVLGAGPDRGTPLLTDGEWLTVQAVCQA
jgi:hypothetical protein